MSEQVQTKIEGSCHCGAITASFSSALPVSSLTVRSCACSFCRRHGAKTFTDPAGLFSLQFRERETSRYMFSTRTAEAIICSICGIYVCMLMADEAGKLFSTINAVGLGFRQLSNKAAEPVSYEGETTAERLRRRSQKWTPTEIFKT